MPLISPKRVSCVLLLLALDAALLSLLVLSDWQLRFTYGPLNNLALITLLLGFPILLAVIWGVATSVWVRWPALVASVLLFLPIGLFCMLAFLEAVDSIVRGVDTSFEMIAEMPALGVVYRVYRTNGGATTDFGLVLRRERQVLPGVVFVRVLTSQYHARDAVLERLPDGRGRLYVSAHGEEHPAFEYDFPM